VAVSSIVAFEGLNCVGKSSLARAVAGRLGVSYVKTPPEGAQNERRLFDERPFSDAAMLYYLSWVKRLSDEAAEGHHGRLVICDRYVGSTLAYFGAAGNPLGELLDRFVIQAPLLTVLVTTTEKVRRARLMNRPELRKIEEATYNKAFRAHVLMTLRSFAPLAEVDTTKTCVEGLVGPVVDAIDRVLRPSTPERAVIHQDCACLRIRHT